MFEHSELKSITTLRTKLPSSQNLRSHEYIGCTQSLCPICLAVVQAKIVSRDRRVYFQKFCPEHGAREDFVCSDARWFDRLDFNVPGREPIKYGIEPNKGCPYDCGLCTQHEQHTCIAVLEITDSCNLTCPFCYASSSPGRKHLTVEQCRTAIDRLIEVEGRAEILQLSGGEPTIHPQFAEIFSYAYQRPIDVLMVNTNGIRIAKDRKLCELIAACKDRGHVYLQMDGLCESIYPVLRGESLLDTKLQAVERLGEHGINTTLVTTLQAGVNVDQIGPLIDFAKQRPWITGLSLQPTTYVGRCIEPESLEQRVTFPDVISEVANHSGGEISESDFFPVPCAHPNSHTLCYAYRHESNLTPITRFVDLSKNFDLLANGISLNRENARKIVEAYLMRESCGPGCDCVSDFDFAMNDELHSINQNDEQQEKLYKNAQSFFSQAVIEELAAADMFRITTTSFMDVYNFDIRQLIKSCVHHLLPSGHLIPFDAYNVLYRNGHVPLPELRTL